MMKSQDQDFQEFSWYLDLLCNVYSDVADAYPAQHRTEFERDLITIRSRFEHEGICFLTKTLPSLAKSIDKALGSGLPLQAPSFAKRKGSHLPRFLGWLLEQVFSSDGVELPHGCPIALGHLRHLLLVFYKLELPYSDEQVQEVLDSFVTTDSQLQQNWILTNEDKHTLRQASSIIGRILGGTDPRWVYPRHGPGAVATREQGPSKSAFRRLYRNLEEVYPFTDYFFFSLSHLCDRLSSRSIRRQGCWPTSHESDSCRSVAATGFDQPEAAHVLDDGRCAHRGSAGASRTLHSVDTVQWPEVLSHSTARVVLVPKDSRGPRLISMEPLEIQWIQQGQMKLLVETLQSHPLTNGQVNFSNQEVNRALALEASRHGNLVTLDMKDASDRVSRHLVWTLFPLNWVRALEASRSAETLLPSGRTVVLHKFAPMGSAVCFPIEALAFWALSVSCIMTKYPHRTLQETAREVWVYGDDIITFRKDYSDVIQFLEKVGLLFNRTKCCTSGFFRESCGMDAYRGVQVTPVRITRRWCHRLVVPTIASYCAYSNAFYDRKYYRAAAYIEECVQVLTRVPYSTVPVAGPSFVRSESDIILANRRRGIRLRFSTKLHRLEAFGWMIRPREEKYLTLDWEELLRVLSSKRQLQSPSPGRQHFRISSNKAFNRAMDREFALNEKSKGSGSVAETELYSLPHRVTSQCGWMAIL